MFQQRGSQGFRPRTMGSTRENSIFKTIEPRLQSTQKIVKQKQINTEKYYYESQKNPEYQHPHYVSIVIPIDNTASQLNQQNKKTNLLSRENIQINNKKYRDIRTSKINPSFALFDLQNDRRLIPMRTISAMGDYGDKVFQTQIRPGVQSLTKISRQNSRIVKSEKRNKMKKNKAHFQKRQNTEVEYEQGILRSASEKKRQKKIKPVQNYQAQAKIFQSSDVIFMPEKQSQSGYILNKFESKLKKRCIEDNLHVMASLLRKKVKVLDKQEMMIYLNKIAKRTSPEK